MSNFGSPGKKDGVEAWRVEKLKPVALAAADIGKFHTGDCYLVLHTKITRSKKDMHLYYWIGRESSQDEQGGVAYLAVELDDSLGGAPIQHREVQGHESKQFMALFRGGIRYLEGGVASAFRHVDPDAYEPRLFHCKGKRNVRVQQAELSSRAMNEGDVFILDAGLTLYQWNGKQANKYEKFKALEMITKIKNQERGGKALTVFMDSGVNDTDETFWKLLGGRAGVQSADAVESDEEVKAQPAVLVKVSDATGSMEFTEVGRGKLDRAMLDPNDVFILDTGAEVFVWIGKGATKAERAKGMDFAAQWLKKEGRPDWTPLTRIPAGGEPPAFQSHFGLWEKPRFLNVDAEEKKEELPADVQALYHRKSVAEEKMIEASGEIEIWRIENMDKVPIPKAQYGRFFAGDSYLVLYSYMVKNKKCYIIYFWQGRNSSSDEKGASALFAVQMDEALGGDPVQVRVVQGKEPSQFLSLFKGQMIVHEGGHASAFKNRNDTDSYDTDGVSLFHVRGTTELNTRAVQVAEVPSSLNSGDCFVLLTPETMFVWEGKGANELERRVANSVAKRLQGERAVKTVPEGEEPEEFWAALGGKGEYPHSKQLEDVPHEPRLFQVSNVTGRVVVTEVFDFCQDDLINDDVMLLDCFSEVYMWIGHDARREEKDAALTIALDFIEKGVDGRDKTTPVFKVMAGSEPPSFTCNFLGWDYSKASDFSDPYEKMLGEVGGKAPQQVTREDVGYAKGKFFPLDVLVNSCPPDVDPKQKEMYLSDEHFKAVLGMTKEEWKGKPEWKKKQLKKKANLF